MQLLAPSLPPPNTQCDTEAIGLNPTPNNTHICTFFAQCTHITGINVLYFYKN